MMVVRMGWWSSMNVGGFDRWWSSMIVGGLEVSGGEVEEVSGGEVERSREWTIADDSEGSAVRSVAKSLAKLESLKPGSSEELAARIFNKGKTASEETQNTKAEDKKKQQKKEFQSNANISPLARFLLSRYQV
ncbi:germinal center kinase 1 isoform X3 [Prunus yedoensis var. nudiflora]|uniref:Germinal center kinase 1 isoform X3 n=1 Tax=Prunus yedoensis var. nudiflora TaxID=2094558 RepID=A0A314ZMB7_PRUYE|nr:germinal center kinase 1 isoform X3 [Prunus yedoensis var. nudiflora]